MELSTVLAERLNDLKQRFVRTVPDRIAAIAATVASLNGGDGEMRERLERQFHSLAGTAGTYDLNAVSAAAAEGEEACAEINGLPPGSGNAPYLTFLVDQLYGALAADQPAQWTAGTLLSATDAWIAISAQTGVIVA